MKLTKKKRGRQATSHQRGSEKEFLFPFLIQLFKVTSREKNFAKKKYEI